MAIYLPQDIILFQIITRVPPKSVIRFKRVSKQWNSLLMSDRFKEMHNRNHLKDHHLIDQKLFFFSEKTATFFTIGCESLGNKNPCGRPLPQFEAYSPFERMHILTSYHGLVCLGIRKSNDGRYISYGRGYGLYYSSCEDDYKLLVVTGRSGNVYIYSLKYDSWRKLNKKAPEKEIEWEWRPGFCLSENIYFQYCNETQGLIRFDTTAERFHKIETPPEFNNNYKRSYTAITLHKGSIHLCIKYDIKVRKDLLKSTYIDMWKLNVDGDIWSKAVTNQLMPNCYDICRLPPVHLMNNGNWLLINYRCGESSLCQVDLMKKKYTQEKDGHKSKGKNKSKGNFHDKYKLYYSNVRVLDPKEVIYTETFVSPNQYMK